MADARRIQRVPLLAAANACMFVFGVVLLLMGSLLPSLQFTYSRSGNLGSFPLAGIFVSTVLVGPILDLFGAKGVLAVALGLVAASLGVMPSLSSYSEFAAAAFLYGLGGGGLNTATNALVADVSAPRRGRKLPRSELPIRDREIGKAKSLTLDPMRPNPTVRARHRSDREKCRATR